MLKRTVAIKYNIKLKANFIKGKYLKLLEQEKVQGLSKF